MISVVVVSETAEQRGNRADEKHLVGIKRYVDCHLAIPDLESLVEIFNCSLKVSSRLCTRCLLMSLTFGLTDLLAPRRLSKNTLSLRCDCLSSVGQCAPVGTYQCRFDGRTILAQCIGDNRWISVRICLFSCHVSSFNGVTCS